MNVSVVFVPILFVFLVFLTLLDGVYMLKLMSYLKKNKLKRYNYLYGNFPDISYDPDRSSLRGWRWLYSNSDEDDGIIRRYKNILRICPMLIIVTLIFLIIV